MDHRITPSILAVFTSMYANGHLIEKGTEATINGDEVNITDPDELTGTADGDYAYFRYTYDLKNRLVQVDKSIEGEVIPVAYYAYDVDGYRVSKTDRDDNVIDYVFDLNGKNPGRDFR